MERSDYLGFCDVQSAGHGTRSISIGHDQAVNWFVFQDGKWHSIDQAKTLEDAKTMGHVQFDKGKGCSLSLTWSLIAETRGNLANACPECGNPATEDDEDAGALRCPDCGWKHQYTSQENDAIRKLHEQTVREFGD